VKEVGGAPAQLLLFEEVSMRFGIMDMQINSLIPRGLGPQQLLSHITAFDHVELVRGLAGQGFDLIELGGDLTLFLPQTFAPPAIEGLAALKEELNLSYTAHIPLWSLEPSTPLGPVREGSVAAVIQFLRAVEPLAPEVYVLHATGPLAAEFYRMDLPDLAKAYLLRLFQGKARESIQTILAETGLASRALAVETVEFPFDLTLELAQDLDLSVCLDVGHVLVGFSGPITLFDALEACLPRLAEVHLHDGPWQGPEHRIGYGQDHRPLGRGDLDTGRFLDRLAEAGFRGPVIFELTEGEAAESLEVIRALRPELLSR
jgi:sugar phosphate isomerase/epimerase